MSSDIRLPALDRASPHLRPLLSACSRQLGPSPKQAGSTYLSSSSREVGVHCTCIHFCIFLMCTSGSAGLYFPQLTTKMRASLAYYSKTSCFRFLIGKGDISPTWGSTLVLTNSYLLGKALRRSFATWSVLVCKRKRPPCSEVFQLQTLQSSSD